MGPTRRTGSPDITRICPLSADDLPGRIRAGASPDSPSGGRAPQTSPGTGGRRNVNSHAEASPRQFDPLRRPRPIHPRSESLPSDCITTTDDHATPAERFTGAKRGHERHIPSVPSRGKRTGRNPPRPAGVDVRRPGYDSPRSVTPNGGPRRRIRDAPGCRGSAIRTRAVRTGGVNATPDPPSDRQGRPLPTGPVDPGSVPRLTAGSSPDEERRVGRRER